MGHRYTAYALTYAHVSVSATTKTFVLAESPTGITNLAHTNSGIFLGAPFRGYLAGLYET